MTSGSCCRSCGKSLSRRIKTYRQVYCNRVCFIETIPVEQRRSIRCGICDTPFVAAVQNSKYCSRSCQDESTRRSLKSSTFYKWRFEILERDEFTCRYCGATPRTNADVKLHVDHINPRKRGVNNSPDNLITACQYCNLGKSRHYYPKIFTLDFPTKHKPVHTSADFDGFQAYTH